MNQLRRVEGGRLVYYKLKANRNFWDKHWRKIIKESIYKGAIKGDLNYFEEPFTKYLPKNGKVLEGGCGTGYYVIALRAKGYDCEGVEWGDETVNAVKKIFPDVPIRLGNVECLDVPDGYYAGYISLGVVEHHPSGPEKIMREAYRVLSKNGTLIVSVPSFNLLRRIKYLLGFYRNINEKNEFYQYAFQKKEIVPILKKIGFKVIDVRGYGAVKGLCDEIPFIKNIFNYKPIAKRITWRIQKSKWVEYYLGHMIMFISIKV